MADIRIAQPIRLVDLDSGNEADVTAAGNLAVEVRIALPAGGNNIGDVDVLTMPGTAVEDAAAAGGETGIAILGVRNDAAASRTSADADFGMIALDAAGRVGIADLGGSITIDGSVSITGAIDTELPAAAALAENMANPTVPGVGAFNMAYDGTTWDRMKGDSTDGLLVNLGANNDVTITGTVDTELPAAAALADATANPTVPGVGIFGHGFNGTTWDRIRTANTGRLQVDVITGGGADTPTNPVSVTVSSSGTAAGASATLDTADLPSKKCWGVDCTSSVSWKAVISTLTNAVATPVTTLFGRAGETVAWRAPHRNFMASGSSAGADGFRAVMTNLDASEASDLYVNFHYSD